MRYESNEGEIRVGVRLRAVERRKLRAKLG